MVTIVQVDLRTGARAVRDQPRLLVGWLLGGVFFAVAGAYAFVAGWAAGAVLRGGELSLLVGSSPDSAAGGLLLGSLAAASFFGLASLADEDTTAPVDVLLRTSVPTSTVVLARQVSQGIRSGSILLVPAVGGVLGLGVGARSPALFVLAFGAVVLSLGTGFVLGRLFGAVGRLVLSSVVRSAWLRLPLQGVAAVGAVVGVWLAIDGRLFGGVVSTWGTATAASVGRGVLWPVEGSPDVAGVIALLALAPAFVLTGVALVRVETRQLAQAERESNKRAATESRGVPALFERRTSALVAWRLLLRSVRAPSILSHLGLVILYPLFVIPVLLLQGTGGVALVGAVVFVVGIVFAGGAYCLNPFGDDRQQTPLVLTSVSDPRVLLHGRALAGLIGGTALALTGIGMLATGGRYLLALGALMISPVLLLSSVGTALGIGTLVPKRERSEYMNVERIHPSILGTTVFEFGGFAIVGAGLGLIFWVVNQGLGPIITWFGVGYLLLVGGTGIGGYAYARQRATDRSAWLTEQ